MKALYPESWPQLYTATIQGWKHLFIENNYKDVIITSLAFLIKEKRIRLNSFVIMSNHVHQIWQALPGHSLEKVQTSFKKFTSLQFIKLLEADVMLNGYQVNAIDRNHHFWKRNSFGPLMVFPCGGRCWCFSPTTLACYRVHRNKQN